MRAFRQDTELTSIPAKGMMEIFKPAGDSRGNAPQALPLNLLATVEGRSSAITATVDGVGAAIPANAEFVVVTATNVGHWFYLPVAVTGKTIRLYIPSNGCEVRSIVAGDKLNNVVIGATNQGALAPAVEYLAVYNGETGNWVMTGLTALGAVQSLVVPDAII